jgi:hypothetical protein
MPFLLTPNERSYSQMLTRAHTDLRITLSATGGNTLVSGRQVERTAEGNMHKVLHFMTDMSVHDGSRWNKHTNTYD